jgi:hypothetical protein
LFSLVDRQWKYNFQIIAFLFEIIRTYLKSFQLSSVFAISISKWISPLNYKQSFFSFFPEMASSRRRPSLQASSAVTQQRIAWNGQGWQRSINRAKRENPRWEEERIRERRVWAVTKRQPTRNQDANTDSSNWTDLSHQAQTSTEQKEIAEIQQSLLQDQQALLENQIRLIAASTQAMKIRAFVPVIQSTQFTEQDRQQSKKEEGHPKDLQVGQIFGQIKKRVRKPVFGAKPKSLALKPPSWLSLSAATESSKIKADVDQLTPSSQSEDMRVTGLPILSGGIADETRFTKLSGFKLKGFLSSIIVAGDRRLASNQE